MIYITVNGFDLTRDEISNSKYQNEDTGKNVIRIVRDKLLAETDWMATSDRTMTQAETDYRQALRNVPTQAGFPENITWPTKP